MIRLAVRLRGLRHGRNLVAQGAGWEAFEALGTDDPHRLQTAGERRVAAREAKALKRSEKLAHERRAFIEDVRRRSPRHAAELEEGRFGAAA